MLPDVSPFFQRRSRERLQNHEAYLGPFIGGGIEYWFAYVLALVVLMARPQGLFGERIIERICKINR